MALGKETKERKTAKDPFNVDNINSMITPNMKLFICNMEKTSHECYSDLKYLVITSDAIQQKTLKVKGYRFILQISSHITILVLLPLCETQDGWMDNMVNERFFSSTPAVTAVYTERLIYSYERVSALPVSAINI